MADLGDQLGWCSTSKDHLKNLSDAINIAENTLNITITVLDSYSFSEFNNLLRPLQETYKKGSDETQKFIQDRHIKYLNDRIKFINEILDEIQKDNH